MAFIPVSILLPHFHTDNGTPLAGGTLELYEAGTTTPAEFFTATGTTLGTSESLDARGEPTADLYLDSAGVYKFRLLDASSVLIREWDNVAPPISANGTIEWLSPKSATFVDTDTFTIEGNPENDAGETVYHVGRSVRIYRHSNDDYLYATILESSYSAGTDTTTVDIKEITDAAGASAALTNESLTTWVGVIGALDNSAPGPVIYVPPVTSGAATRIQGAVDVLGAAGGGRVQLGSGTYDLSTTQIANTFDNVEIVGVGTATKIEYSGTDSAVFMGSTTSGDYKRRQRLADVFVQCTDKASQVVGAELRNSIHFALENLTLFGANDPNAAEPLKGAGIHVTEQSFIGRLSKIDSRLWADGIRISTDAAATFDDGWAAALEISGHGELQNNNYGLRITGTGGNATGTMISARDITVEGNYLGGINAEQGNKVLVDGVYFEANAGFNVLFGAVVSGTISNSNQAASPLLTTPYGSVTYQAHVVVESSTSTNIFGNNFALSSGSTPIIEVQAGASSTRIETNRLASSTLSSDEYISDAASNTVIRENHGLPDIVWETATLENSWASTGGAFAGASFALDKTRKDRRVYLRGQIDTGAAGTTALTLPAGYRPANRKEFGIAGLGSVAAVLTDGSVVITQKQTSSVSLDNVEFFV